MKNISWTLLALLLGALPASAQPASGKLESFDAIDRNADGLLQWEEVRNQMVRIFHDADRDGNGVLTADEFSFGGRHFELADANKDGKVTQRELIAYAAAVFGAADTSGDEKLSREEAAAAKQKEGLQ
jgi:Ca2+-binding EF-hand superfamily protein